MTLDTSPPRCTTEHGPVRRGAAWALRHHMHRGGRCHRCAEVGLMRRVAPRSAAERDGSDQRVAWAGSGTQGSSDRGREPPRHGATGPCCRQRDEAAWQLGPTESHSFDMRPSCSAQPRNPHQPLCSCGCDSDPTIWISSLPCEYGIAMNVGAGVTCDHEWSSQVGRWLLRHMPPATGLPEAAPGEPQHAHRRRSRWGSLV